MTVVRKFAYDAENNRKMGLQEIGGCTIVPRILEKYGLTNDKIAEEGLRAMINLSANNAENKAALGASGGIQITVNLLEHYGDSQGNILIIEIGLRAVRNFSGFNLENSALLGKVGACEIVINILDRYFAKTLDFL